jgi:hypothetical protein
MVVLYIFFLGLFLLGSCYPEFRNPIPPPSELKADNKLTGTWKRTTESGTREHLCVFERQSGWLDVVYIYDINSKYSSDGINVLIFEGYNTNVNENKFLCLRYRQKDHPDQNVYDINYTYFVANYKTTKNGILIIRPFWSEAVQTLVEKGKLAGEIKKADLINGQPYDRVIITESSNSLGNFINTYGIKEFLGEGEYALMTFSRLR